MRIKSNKSKAALFTMWSILFGLTILFIINLSSQRMVPSKTKEFVIQQSPIEDFHNEPPVKCDRKKSQDSGGYCLSKSNPFTGGNEKYSFQLCKNIENLVQKSTIGDFGAGLGHYGMCFQRRLVPFNAEKKSDLIRQKKTFEKEMKAAKLMEKSQVVTSWEGFDGALNVDDVTNAHVKHLDLSEKIDLGKKYDWVMSLEVGEHIPELYEDVYIENLVQHLCKGLILSWAVPKQGGFHHINNRSNKYVIEKIESKGMKHDVDATENLKQDVTNKYFRNTLMVFRKLDVSC